MKFRKLTALFLVLCMMLSLGVSAFAAEKTPDYKATRFSSRAVLLL